MVIASGQKVTFSSEGRTASFKDGKYFSVSEPGSYTFSTLTIKSGALVRFGSSESLSVQPLTIGNIYS